MTESCGTAVEEVLNYFKVKVRRPQFRTTPTTTIPSCFIQQPVADILLLILGCRIKVCKSVSSAQVTHRQVSSTYLRWQLSVAPYGCL